MTDKASELPAKFNTNERRAYQWLYDSKIVGWSVDLLDKSVTTDRGIKFVNLIAFAKHRGMNVKWKP